MHSKKSVGKERRPLVTPIAATLPPRPNAESVEAFLARGGTIERLDHGARGQPHGQTFRQMMTFTTSARIERLTHTKKK